MVVVVIIVIVTLLHVKYVPLVAYLRSIYLFKCVEV